MLRLLITRPRFRRLWSAGTLSLIGDWLSFVAVSLLALDRGGGALALATMLAVHALPQALLMPVAGVLADRLDRRTILVAAPLVQAALTGLMAVAAARGALVTVQALLLVRSAAGAFVLPAETAALRYTVERDELIAANALVSSTWSLAYIVGMALGGAIAVLGPAPAIALDALTFVIAAGLLRGLPAMPAPVVAARPSGGHREFADAFRYARAHPGLFRAVFAKAPLALAGGAGWLVMNVVAGRSAAFGTGAVALGALQAVRGAGTALGPMVIARLPVHHRDARLALILCGAAGFAGIALFPVVEGTPALLVAIALVWGMGIGANWVLSSAAIQRLSPDTHIGRLASLDELSNTCAMIAGAFVAAAVLDATERVTAAALIGVLAGALSWLWLHGGELIAVAE